MLVALMLACANPPAAPLQGPGVPAATQTRAQWPADLLGGWLSLDDLDGRWVVSVPCNHGPSTLAFAEAPGAGRLHWSHGPNDEDWTLTAITEEDGGYQVDLRPAEGAVQRHVVRFIDPDRHHASIDGTGPFVREPEARWVEHLYQSPADCGRTDVSPWGDANAAPNALYRLVWMDGVWRRPPDSGTAPELTLSSLATPPELQRRTGAGVFSYPLVTARHDQGLYWLTVSDGTGGRFGVTIRPWQVPEALPALPPSRNGKPSPTTGDAPTTPPPAGAWLVHFGREGLDLRSAWVTELPR